MLDSPADRSDLRQFLSTYTRGNPPDDWWRANLNLPSYHSYRAICECIHHYDIGDGKNYDYFHNPVSRQWQVIPWDSASANERYVRALESLVPCSRVYWRPELRACLKLRGRHRQ